PERGDQAGDGRTQRAAPVVEVEPAQHPFDAVRDDEDEEDVAGVVVDPSVQARLAGGPYPDVRSTRRDRRLARLAVAQVGNLDGAGVLLLGLDDRRADFPPAHGGLAVDRGDDVAFLESALGSRGGLL